MHIRSAITKSEKKYIVALFVDIQGAFDNLWWPTIMARLAEANVSSNIMRIINSYFKNRKVIITAKYKQYHKYMKKGCPQGSILGPAAWNWCMDALLSSINNEFPQDTSEAIAYADDVVFLIKANTRAELEKCAENIVEKLTKWCTLHKLKISTTKTTAMLIKGKLNKERNPIIKIDDVKVQFTSQVKYLGVILDDRCSFIPHVKYVRSKLISYICVPSKELQKRNGVLKPIQNIYYIIW